jgi:hypothetical protein
MHVTNETFDTTFLVLLVPLSKGVRRAGSILACYSFGIVHAVPELSHKDLPASLNGIDH